jgi:RHS repeat-associated protein
MTCPTSSVAVSTTTNRITTSGYGYDANGNMTNDGQNTLTYDAENHLLTSSGGLGSGTYTYDGSGHRVKKVSGSTTTVYAFSGTKVIAEYVNGAAPTSPTREYIYSGGALLAKVESSATQYYHSDHLSTRLMTDSSGTKIGEQGHYPFGESWYASGTTTKWEFTSYERDSESGNDFAMARYHVNRLGRFSSPDLHSGSVADPQSLNKYGYVLDDPANLVDPLGLEDCLAGAPCTETPSGGGGGSDQGPNNLCNSASCQTANDFNDKGEVVNQTATLVDGSGLVDTGNTGVTAADGSSGGIGGGLGGGGGELRDKIKKAIKNAVKKLCSVLPDGSVNSVGNYWGAVGSVGGSLDVVKNYNTGEVSGFATGGGQAGWNGGVSVTLSTGMVWGLGNSNANYSGGFKGGNVSVSIPDVPGVSVGGSVMHGNGGVTVASVTAGASLLGRFGFGGSYTNTSAPLALGSFTAFGIGDYAGYGARQLCK